MAAAHDFDIPARVHFGQACVHFTGQEPLCKRKIKMGKQFNVEEHAFRMRRDLIGQGLKNARDLLLLACAKLLEVVAQLHNEHGLDKQRGPGGALVVHKAGHVGAALCLNGNAVAVAAHGDDAILKVFGKAGGTDHLVKLFAHALVGAADLAADLKQLRGRAVRDFLLAENGGGNIVFQTVQCGDAAGHAGKDGGILAVAHQGALRRASSPGAEAGALLRKSHLFAHIRKAAEGLAAQIAEQHAGLLGFVKRVQHIGKIIVRL